MTVAVGVASRSWVKHENEIMIIAGVRMKYNPIKLTWTTTGFGDIAAMMNTRLALLDLTKLYLVLFGYQINFSAGHAPG